MRAHLDEAHAAADRLVRGGRSARPARPPPRVRAGAAARLGGAGRREPATSDLQALLALLDGVREAVPAELSRQLAAALRDLLLALRALIDWYLERLGEPARAALGRRGRGHPAGLTWARRRLTLPWPNRAPGS